MIEVKRSIKSTCECGSVYGINKLSRHIQSKKHANYLKSKNQLII